MTEADMLQLLAARYEAPAWAFLRHVADGTGMRKNRTLDAMAMSLWPSRGLHLHGFEVKVSRGDWQRELADPAKADGFAAVCHAFWLVAPKEIVRPGELPPTWGLLVPHGKGLRVEKEAPLQERPPLPWDMLAAFLRGVVKVQEDMIPRSEIAAQLDAARRAGAERARSEADTDASEAERRLSTLRQNIEVFEASSGIKLSSWQGQRIGEAVRQVLANEQAGRNARRCLESTRDQFARVLASLNTALAPETEDA